MEPLVSKGLFYSIIVICLLYIFRKPLHDITEILKKHTRDFLFRNFVIEIKNGEMHYNSNYFVRKFFIHLDDLFLKPSEYVEYTFYDKPMMKKNRPSATNWELYDE